METVGILAGCTPKNRGITCTKDALFYVSGPNVIRTDGNKATDAIFMSDTLNCINSLENTVITGDRSGNVYTLDSENKIKQVSINSCIQDCCLVSEDIWVFSTLKCIYLHNHLTNKTTRYETDYLVTRVYAYHNVLYVGESRGSLYIYRMEGLELILECTEKIHQDGITDILITYWDEIATSSLDGNIAILNYESGKVEIIQILNLHSDWISCIAPGKPGIYYSASYDKTIKIWTKDSKDDEYTVTGMEGGTSAYLGVCMFLSLYGQCKTGGIDKFYVPREETCICGNYPAEYFVTGHTGEVTGLSWNKKMLLTSSFDGTARIFYREIECGRPMIHGYPINDVLFFPGNKVRFAGASEETIIRFYGATKEFYNHCREVDECRHLTGQEMEVPEEENAILSELSLTNEITEECSGTCLSEAVLSANVFIEEKKLYGHYFDVRCLATNGDAIFSSNRSISKQFAGLFMWDMEGNKLQYITDHTLGIQKIACNKRNVLTVSRDKTACLYQIVEGILKHVKRIQDHTRVVWGCGFSRNGECFCTCSRDGRAILYDTETAEKIRERDFGEEVTAVAFSPTRDIIAIGLKSGKVQLLSFDLKTIDEERTNCTAINVLSFDEKGTKLATGGSDGLVRVVRIKL